MEAAQTQTGTPYLLVKCGGLRRMTFISFFNTKTATKAGTPYLLVCIEDLVEKQNKTALFKVTEPSQGA